ncbi:hypothetical protein SNEBB_009659 [Seison nebaliae]|nr:hypothetical protein SNEBB_009659 [Seison nebaliae]
MFTIHKPLTTDPSEKNEKKRKTAFAGGVIIISAVVILCGSGVAVATVTSNNDSTSQVVNETTSSSITERTSDFFIETFKPEHGTNSNDKANSNNEGDEKANSNDGGDGNVIIIHLDNGNSNDNDNEMENQNFNSNDNSNVNHNVNNNLNENINNNDNNNNNNHGYDDNNNYDYHDHTHHDYHGHNNHDYTDFEKSSKNYVEETTEEVYWTETPSTMTTTITTTQYKCYSTEGTQPTRKNLLYGQPYEEIFHWNSGVIRINNLDPKLAFAISANAAVIASNILYSRIDVLTTSFNYLVDNCEEQTATDLKITKIPNIPFYLIKGIETRFEPADRLSFLYRDAVNNGVLFIFYTTGEEEIIMGDALELVTDNRFNGAVQATIIAMIVALEMASRENGQGEKDVLKKKRPNGAERSRLSLEPTLNLEEGKTPTTKGTNISCKDAINDADELKKSTRGRTKSKNQRSSPDLRSSFVIDPSVQVTSTTLMERLETFGNEHIFGLDRIAEINDKLQNIFNVINGMRDEIVRLKKQLGNNECEQRALGIMINDLNGVLSSQSNTVENEHESKLRKPKHLGANIKAITEIEHSPRHLPRIHQVDQDEAINDMILL